GFLGGLSTDFFGASLRRELVASGVDLRHVQLSDRPTTLAVVSLADGQASYAFYDENSAGRMLSEAGLPVLGDDSRALPFSCSRRIAHPGCSAHGPLIRRERRRRLSLLDPNLRAAFIGDRDRHLARMRRMIAMADIVKLSAEALAWFGEEGSAAEIARGW